MLLWVLQFYLFLQRQGTITRNQPNTKPSKVTQGRAQSTKIHTILESRSLKNIHSRLFVHTLNRNKHVIVYIFSFWITESVSWITTEHPPTTPQQPEIVPTLTTWFRVAPELWSPNPQACKLKNKYNISICKVTDKKKLKCYKLFVFVYIESHSCSWSYRSVG